MTTLALVALLAAVASPLGNAVSLQNYTWNNVVTGGGGGFIPNVVFNPSEKGLAFLRTDIGGAYRLNSNDSWTPLVDWVDNARWDQWGTDAIATDPVDTNRLYIVGSLLSVECPRVVTYNQAAGMYTNSWDPNNGTILISTDQGNTFTSSPLPFKVILKLMVRRKFSNIMQVGGNMPGRGMGEVTHHHYHRHSTEPTPQQSAWRSIRIATISYFSGPGVATVCGRQSIMAPLGQK